MCNVSSFCKTVIQIYFHVCHQHHPLLIINSRTNDYSVGGARSAGCVGSTTPTRTQSHNPSTPTLSESYVLYTHIVNRIRLLRGQIWANDNIETPSTTTTLKYSSPRTESRVRCVQFSQPSQHSGRVCGACAGA